MVSQMIEQCAKAKHLGTFQQRYSEAISLAVVLIFSFLFVFSAIGFVWQTLTIPQGVPVCFPLILDPIAMLLLIWIWRGYLASRENWLYLYDDGFVSVHQGQIKGYHVEDIRSVRCICYLWNIWLAGESVCPWNDDVWGRLGLGKQLG